MRIACSLLLALVFSLATFAQEFGERILNFHSDIAVHRDASMTVRESITVMALHDQINRGIYRDFPTRYRDRFGRTYVVRFHVVSVTRDGQLERYRTEAIANGVRVYMGDPNTLVPTGQHTYVLTYETDRQLGFFEDHDELYWNVTGNDWIFPIDRASATVALPGVPREQIRVEGYTGAFGERGQDYRAWVDEQGRAQFVTTRPLAPGEGLTIAVAFPKGYVEPPSLLSRLDPIVWLPWLGLFTVLGYFLWSWHRVGKDPAKGTIIPRYEPPKDFSPAGVRYVSRMGADFRAFAAAVIAAAVKGRVSVHEHTGIFGARSYTIVREADSAEAATSTLSREEEALLGSLLPYAGSSIKLDQENYRVVQAAKRALDASLNAQYRGLFSLNTGNYLVGLLLTFAVLGTVVFLFFTDAAVASGSFIGGWGVIIPPLLALVALNILFYHLIKAPTVTGRRIMDDIEGFRMYLETAEGDWLKSAALPDPTPELFERYLPYALALGVEQQWGEKFTSVLASAAQEGRAHRPSWYYGESWNAMRTAAFTSSLGSAFSGAISSSSSPPGSSSGSGGGGSSGGGGGGGGGGGW